MKKVLLFFGWMLLFTSIANAQVPQGIPYQAVARNGQGQPLASTNVKVRFSILDSTAIGTAVYVESHSTTTSALGLFSANVGMGTASTGTFSSINWGQNFKFLKVELDTTATGNSYIDLGTQQMMSVPYALYAGKVSVLEGNNGNTSSRNTHYIGEKFGGGVVFYIWTDSTGSEHGLVVALKELGLSQGWSNIKTTQIGISAQSTWDGLSNSNAIVGQLGHISSAAKLCLDLDTCGYNDWYLPSTDELSLLWHNRFLVNKSLLTISGSAILRYGYWWSSTEANSNRVWSFDSEFGYVSPIDKTISYIHVRAVRAF